VLKLLLELFLIEQLPAGDAINLCPQFCNAVFVGVLLLFLTCDQPSENIVVEGEISAGRKRPARHDDEASNRNPKRERSEPKLAAGVRQRVVCALTAGPGGA
jgi:hypothetical protein